MTWSPEQYVKFERQRTRPARDLLAQVSQAVNGPVWDLGCGPGNSTELLAERFGTACVSGLDSDEAMLAAARERLPGVRFDQADLAQWVPPAPAALLYANAVFQWLPDHLGLLDRLLDHLRPGGVLAVQMPDNLMEPTHLLMEESATAGPWRQAFEGYRARRDPLPPPVTYFDRLGPKCADLDVWHIDYNHPMADAGAIVEWVRGTGLRRYLDRVDPQWHAGFIADYTERIEKAYPPMADGRPLLRFPRLFLIATRQG